MRNKIYRLLLFFLIFLIALQFLNKKQDSSATAQDDIVITSGKQFVLGQDFLFQIKNNTDKPLEIASKCPEPPLALSRYGNGAWNDLSAGINQKMNCDATPIVVEPKKSGEINLTPWSLIFFKNEGQYRVSYATVEKHVFSHEFEVTPTSFLRSVWNTVFFKPIFNTLIFFLSIAPGKNLGLAILLLTIVIKLLLLGPNQKALKSQKKMQELQPHLEALKIKHKGDSQKLAQETMALWKKFNVSPAGSCLPMLIQFPILIALFYVVKSDLNSVNNTLFLYDTFKTFDLSTIQTNLFGILELTKKNVLALPIIVGLLQFVQMRLTLGKKKPVEPKPAEGVPNPGPMMNQMMIYMMPVMIAFFTASMPAAVGFYWGASTLFGIGQQLVVNRSKN
ncbi:YidC/Oxa1 family membrane protein insertase [Candidatus Peregrinibacteria bacterium]|nr:YidC/Oxa1 family membrane protein insertase [Candidatus Peregrinibacteria bacterium]